MTDRLARFVRLLVAVALTECVLSGCAGRTPLTSRLDSNGLTVVTLADPIILALPVHQLSSAARDYAYLGPVEINRMGKRDHFVWIGLASTIDRKLAAIPPTAMSELTLLVDNWPMTLPLLDWSAELEQPPYKTTTPLYATLAARISLDQIQRIADSETVQVRFVTSSGASRLYREWQGEWSSWSLLAATQ